MQYEQKSEMGVQLLFSQSNVTWHHHSYLLLTAESESPLNMSLQNCPLASLTPLQVLEGTLDHMDPNGIL